MKPKKRTLISDKRIGDKLNDRLLTLGEVSQLCQCSERKIRVWIKEGRLAHVAMGDGKSVASMIRVRESALSEFWDQNERKALP